MKKIYILLEHSHGPIEIDYLWENVKDDYHSREEFDILIDKMIREGEIFRPKVGYIEKME